MVWFETEFLKVHDIWDLDFDLAVNTEETWTENQPLMVFDKIV